MLRAKLSDTKQCPSCGWLMKLATKPDPREIPAPNAEVSRVRFYECVNRACEHAECVRPAC